MKHIAFLRCFLTQDRGLTDEALNSEKIVLA